MEKERSREARLNVGVSALAIGASLLFSGGQAFAQQAGADGQAAPADETIVVHGFRASLRNSLDVKRTAAQVMDVISAEDIGAFPDKNVSEALQRVTGVQIFRQDGEGRGISIRGTDPSLTRVEINGASALALSVGAGDRTVDFRDLPVEFISRLEVVKSPTADMTEGGVGGTVRVVTRRPFDSNEPFLAGSAQAIYSNIARSYDPKFALIGSHLFFNNTLGVLLSGVLENRHLYSDNARTTGWIRRDGAAGVDSDLGFPAGDGINEWIPEIPRQIIDRRYTERRSLSGIVEWRPSDELRVYLDNTYATATEAVSSTLMQLNGNSGNIDYATTTEGQDHTVNHYEFTSSTARPIDLAFRNILGDLTRTQYTNTLGANWRPGNWNINARIDYSNADVQNNEINSTATIFGVPRAIVDYRGGEGAPNFSFPGIDVTSGAAVNRLDAVFNPRNNHSEEMGEKIDVRYDFDSGFLRSISGGVQSRNYFTRQILFGRTSRLNCATAPAATSAGAVTVFTVPCSTISNLVDTYSVTNPIGFFPTGDLGYTGGVKFWNDNTIQTYTNTLAAVGATDNVYAVNPNPNTAQNAGGPGSYQNFLETWKVSEQTLGAYLSASFSLDSFAIPITGNVGMRYVDTGTISSGFNRTQQGTVINFIPGAQSGGYTKYLPSINLRFDLIPDRLIGRASAAKVLARSPPSQLALRRSLDIVGLTGSRGNPNLQPFQATQYDLGLEWYMSQDNFLSVAVFRKEITSFIINSAPTPEVVDGVTYNVTSPFNPNLQVTINGIEIGIQYSLDFLPAPFDGFGVLANYTRETSDGFLAANALTPATSTSLGGAYPFPGLSETSYNWAFFYENDTLSARLSYNWRDQWLITANGRGNLPEFNEAFGSLDFSGSYNITPNLTFFADALNLLDNDRIENNTAVRRIGHETFGQRVFAGFRARF